MALEWKIVRDSWNRKPIGAVGFLGDEIATIVAFHDDKDANEDGTVEAHERFLSLFSMKGRAVAKVASHAYADPDILMRDSSISQWRGKLLTAFASGLIVEGIYKSYFAFGISRAAGALAGAVTSNTIKSYVIKKSLEKTVEKAYKASMGL
ncbi:MAG: hypothetical protein M0R03_15760 [Novosphingobium sp.]|nr:hypothetical protein [Novosphingobium sp.]